MVHGGLRTPSRSRHEWPNSAREVAKTRNFSLQSSASRPHWRSDAQTDGGLIPRQQVRNPLRKLGVSSFIALHHGINPLQRLAKINRSVDKSGSSRKAHNLLIAGSNPAAATIALALALDLKSNPGPGSRLLLAESAIPSLTHPRAGPATVFPALPE